MLPQHPTPEPQVGFMHLENSDNFSFHRSPLEPSVTFGINVLALKQTMPLAELHLTCKIITHSPLYKLLTHLLLEKSSNQSIPSHFFHDIFHFTVVCHISSVIKVVIPTSAICQCCFDKEQDLPYHPLTAYSVFNMNQKQNICCFKMSLSLYRLNETSNQNIPACGTLKNSYFPSSLLNSIPAIFHI